MIMKKSELKTGMYLLHRDGSETIVMIGTERGDIVVDKDISQCIYPENFKRLHNQFELSYWDDDLISNTNNPGYDVMMVRGCYGHIIYERKEKIIELDGIEYSEATLRSLIKKATK